MEIPFSPAAENADYLAATVTTPEERAAVFAVRMVVFVEEQAVPPEEELDALDVTATHFLARLKLPQAGDPLGIVGAARLVDKGGSVGKIGRVAVLREHRGRGVGVLLMRVAEEAARAQGMTRVVLDAQCQAIPFYERLGYTAEGDVFLDAGIEHRLMWKDLAGAA
ncbi:MAG TPA: GNAT family N-acetyltransferase [Chthonomonadaceae bacterium]|nr:GNAT family N-acetyltransferase [Chthonomonadaceae bacterium]